MHIFSLAEVATSRIHQKNYFSYKLAYSQCVLPICFETIRRYWVPEGASDVQTQRRPVLLCFLNTGKLTLLREEAKPDL